MCAGYAWVTRPRVMGEPKQMMDDAEALGEKEEEVSLLYSDSVQPLGYVMTEAAL